MVTCNWLWYYQRLLRVEAINLEVLHMCYLHTAFSSSWCVCYTPLPSLVWKCLVERRTQCTLDAGELPLTLTISTFAVYHMQCECILWSGEVFFC